MTKKRVRLLIGYDGSNDADAAIEDLVHAGLPREVEAVIVGVCDSPAPAEFSGSSVVAGTVVGDRARSIVNHAKLKVSEASQQVSETMLSAEMRLRSDLPWWHVRRAILVGDPAVELIKKAERVHADLIVVGSQGRSAIGRLILGSVSLEVATRARCSVRIGRRTNGKKNGVPLKILIGLNCSAHAEKALRKVLMRTWPEGTELRIVAVDDGVSPITTKMFAAKHGKDSAVLEGKFVKLAESKGLTISAGIKEGEPQRILIAEARKWKADCVVVGSRGMKNSLWGSFGGSVSTWLAAHAGCSVEIIR